MALRAISDQSERVIFEIILNELSISPGMVAAAEGAVTGFMTGVEGRTSSLSRGQSSRSEQK